MEERYQQRRAPEEGPTDEPMPAEEVAGDHLNDWLSRSTGFLPARWLNPVTTEWRPSRRLCSAPREQGLKARLSTARHLNRC